MDPEGHKLKVLKKGQEVDLEVLKGQVAGLKAPRGQAVDPPGRAVDRKVPQGQKVVPQDRAVGPKALQGQAVDLRVPQDQNAGLRARQDLAVDPKDLRAQEEAEIGRTYLLSAR